MTGKVRAAGALAATAAVAASLLATAVPAGADPVPTGSFRTFAGVGSDVTAEVMNAAAGDVPGVTGVFPVGRIGSYDATGSATIRTRSNGPVFHRPTEGRTVLYYSKVGYPYRGTDDVTGQIDFGRTTTFSATGSADTSRDGRVADYVPFARDAVSYAFTGGTAVKIGKLSTDQLVSIYAAASSVVINGVTITAVLPRQGSGTRVSWLNAIGLTEASVGAGVSTRGDENDGSVLQPGDATHAEVVPYSVAQYVAQANGVDVDRRNNVTLGRPNGKVVYTVDADTGTLAPYNTYFNSAPFGRSVYNVIDDATATPALRRLFVNDGDTLAPLCTTSGLSLSARYGFVPIDPRRTGQQCGVIVQGAYPIPAPTDS